MTTTNPTRRRMLQLVAGTAVTGLAGCSSTGGQSGGDTETAQQETSTDHHEAETDHHEAETDHHEETESGHGHEGGHDEVGEPTDHAEVQMITNDGEYHFAPHIVRVNVGGTVTFHNESGSHATAAYHPDNDKPQLVPDGAVAWDSGLLTDQGATFEHTFQTEGVYHYYCQPHEALGHTH